MDDLVVHGKHEHMLEILLKQSLELGAGLAIDMAGLARRRGIGLRFERRRADHEQAVFGERLAQIGQIGVLVHRRDVLDDVEAEQRFVLARQGRGDDVVDLGLERPALVAARADVLDEQRVEIVDGDVRHLLEHDARAEGVAAADLADIAAARQHLGDEFVARQEERQPARIVVPDLVGHQAERGQPDRIAQFEAAIVLRLARLLGDGGQHAARRFRQSLALLARGFRTPIGLRGGDLGRIDGEPHDEARHGGRARRRAASTATHRGCR